MAERQVMQCISYIRNYLNTLITLYGDRQKKQVESVN